MSHYAVKLDGKRIGSVARFAGNKPAERWAAYSVSVEGWRGFRTLGAAKEWLAASYEHEPETPDCKTVKPVKKK